jgi:putative endopeptidase
MKQPEKALYTAKVPHSLRRSRVDRSLSNMPEFQKAFACRQGQPMVHEPACRVW